MVLGTSRFVTRRAGSQLGVQLTATVTAVAVATLLVLAVALPPRVAGTTYRHAVSEQPANHVMRASTAFDAEQWPTIDRNVQDAVTASGLPFSTSATTWISSVTSPVLPDGTNVVIGSMSDATDRAELVDGSWPQAGAASPEVVMHETALESTGLSVGDEFEIESSTADSSPTTTIVGVYRPNNPDDPVWREYGHGVIPGSAQQVTLIGPVLADQTDFLEHLSVGPGTAAWTMVLDVSEVSFSDGDATAAAVSQTETTIEGLDNESVPVITRLGEHLDRAYVAASAARSVLLGAVAMLAVLAVWALTFTARLVAARRSAATALLRARGVSPGVLARWSALGGLPFAVGVMIAAPILGTLAIRWLTSTNAIDDIGNPPWADTASWLTAIAASFGWLVLLVTVDYSTGRSMASVAVEHSRPPRRAAVQRAGLDVVMLGLAALGLQQLRRPAGETPDLVLMLAPAVVVLAGALILARALPWIGYAASALTTRLRGFSPSLGTLDLARRPLRHGAAAVLLVLALAVSIVTSATNSTWHDFRNDAVNLAEPVDVRVDTDPEAHPGSIREDIESLEGVESVTGVARFTDTSDDTQPEIFVIDAEAGSAVARSTEQTTPVYEAVADESEMSAAVTTSYAGHYGYRPGDRFQVTIGGDSIGFEISKIVETIPGTLNEYAVLVNRNAPDLAGINTDPTLDEHENRPDCTVLGQLGADPSDETVAWCSVRAMRSALWPVEWWVSTSDGQLPGGMDEIDGVTAVHSHEQASAEADDDPATAGVLNALSGTLGFTAIFLLIGSIVQAVAAYRARANEHAQLRAMGFTGRGTFLATAIEHLLLLAFAAVAGIGLGSFVAWVTVPHTVGGLAGLPAVPPLQFSLPWGMASALTLALTLLMTLVVIVASLGLRRVNIVGVLREGGD